MNGQDFEFMAMEIPELHRKNYGSDHRIAFRPAEDPGKPWWPDDAHEAATIVRAAGYGLEEQSENEYSMLGHDLAGAVGVLVGMGMRDVGEEDMVLRRAMGLGAPW